MVALMLPEKCCSAITMTAAPATAPCVTGAAGMAGPVQTEKQRIGFAVEFFEHHASVILGILEIFAPILWHIPEILLRPFSDDLLHKVTVIASGTQGFAVGYPTFVRACGIGTGFLVRFIDLHNDVDPSKRFSKNT
jgi:hypothetical protein